MFGVSYLTSPPSYDHIRGLTYGTLTEEDRRASRSSWDGRDLAASAAVLVIILVAYLYFNG